LDGAFTEMTSKITPILVKKTHVCVFGYGPETFPENKRHQAKMPAFKGSNQPSTVQKFGGKVGRRCQHSRPSVSKSAWRSNLTDSLSHNYRERPIAAVRPPSVMPKCGPSDRTFAARAKWGDGQTHTMRTKVAFAAIEPVSPLFPVHLNDSNRNDRINMPLL
jgi:hypothetical protein